MGEGAGEAPAPVNHLDQDGRILDTIWDIYSVASGIYSAAKNTIKGNFKDALLDVVGVGADLAAVVVPGVPAVGSTTVKAIKTGDKLVDAAKVLNKADDVVDAGRVVNKAEDVVDAGKASSRGQKTYQVYKKYNPETGETYIGRTSGYGSPQENIKRRDRNHHKNKDGFERAELIISSEDPDAIRGAEQYYIDLYGGAKSMNGTSGNAINGISPKNPNRKRYEEARKNKLGF